MREEGALLSIGEVADATGLSVHSLRYYEAEGLIPDVTRDGAGHRRYRAEHVQWLGLLERLRVSGMSIARTRQYVELAVRGDATVLARKELLEEHETDLRERIAELDDCLAIVRAKIDLYAGTVQDVTEVRTLVAKAQARRSLVSTRPRSRLL
jgi:DNA-binding transcriptional MerR regulator